MAGVVSYLDFRPRWVVERDIVELNITFDFV